MITQVPRDRGTITCCKYALTAHRHLSWPDDPVVTEGRATLTTNENLRYGNVPTEIDHHPVVINVNGRRVAGVNGDDMKARNIDLKRQLMFSLKNLMCGNQNNITGTASNGVYKMRYYSYILHIIKLEVNVCVIGGYHNMILWVGYFFNIWLTNWYICIYIFRVMFHKSLHTFVISWYDVQYPYGILFFVSVNVKPLHKSPYINPLQGV